MDVTTFAAVSDMQLSAELYGYVTSDIRHVSETWGSARRAEIADGALANGRPLADPRRGDPGLAAPFTRLWLVPGAVYLESGRSSMTRSRLRFR